MNDTNKELSSGFAIGFIVALLWVVFTIIIKAFWELAPLGIVIGVMIWWFIFISGFSFWKSQTNTNEQVRSKEQ